jgi:uncharacterized protein (TIGR03435 family)
MLAAGWLTGLAMAQPLPEFDAAYIQPASLEDAPRLPNGRFLPGFGPQGGPGTSEPGQLTCSHCSLERLVQVAYEKNFGAITPLPWMRDELYDLIAKVPAGSSEHDVHLMLQQLLNERFRLTVHHVSRDLPGFVLTVGKRSPQLQSVAVGTEGQMPNPYLEDCLLKVNAKANSMSELADLLTREENTTVVDKTGLGGRYHFSFAWFPTRQLAGEGRCTPKHMPAGRDPLDAVRKQLGLKVESRRVPTDAVIVDSALKAPAGN